MKKITFTLLVAMLCTFALYALPESKANVGLDSFMENYTTTSGSVIQRMDVITAKVDSVHTQIKSDAEKSWCWQDIDVSNVQIAFWGLIVGIIGCIIGYLGYRASKRTADNVVRASFNVQKGQFDDLIRHLYRNLVCTLAFTQKIVENRNPKQTQDFKPFSENPNSDEQEKYQYPSEEHLLKLKVLPEDVLHLESYNNDFTIYTKMHELKLLLRNYDIEIDTAMTHLKENAQDKTMIMGNLDTLTFKPLFLISKIVGVVKSLDEKEAKKLKGKNIDEYQNAASIMTRSHVKNLIDHKDAFKINEYLDLNLRLTLEKTGKADVDKEAVKEPYNGLGRAYNLFFKEIIEANEKDFVEYGERFDDKKKEDENYAAAIERICGKDKVKQNDAEPTERFKRFRDTIIAKGNLPFKEHFLTMLSIDTTIELSKIHMIDINKPV